ncbi:MAG: trypsin-like peptidase domain-containing protein [Ruminococcus sp.]|nr:trypsin-like peptidase domain-containing protein [Ruminococcus sp.]
MNEFENKNIDNGTEENVSPVQNTETTGSEVNAGSGNTSGSTYNDYRSGYYRNTNPHQDEPVSRTVYTNAARNAAGTYTSTNTYGQNGSQPNSYGSYQNTAYTNQTGTQNGYNYANYYNNQNSVQQQPEKKKKKGGWLKIAALVTAVAVVAGASFAGGYFANKNNDKPAKNNIVQSNSSSDKNNAAENKKPQNTTPASGNAQSLFELAAREDAITIPQIVEKLTPSVVGIQATYIVQTQSDFPSNFGFNFGYFGWGDSSQPQTKQAVGTGTGVIMSEDGYIITNAHVIYDSTSGYGAAQSVEVQMSDQETIYPAEIVAYDVESDLAVLKIDQTGLTPAEFGNSDECQVGELVVAIGNPLGLELQNTVTCGIISALNREVTINDKEMTLIQTDTAINSGNSGGPLINSAGQVVGINSAKMSSSYSSGSASIEGIGFAIPITEAKEIVDDLINYGYVTGRPQLGITCQDVSEAVSQAYNIPVGSYIISITEGGAADKAGLQIQDVIIAIDGNEIKTTEELNDYKNEHDAGEEVVLTIVRYGQQMDVTVILEETVASTEPEPDAVN